MIQDSNWACEALPEIGYANPSILNKVYRPRGLFDSAGMGCSNLPFLGEPCQKTLLDLTHEIMPI